MPVDVTIVQLPGAAVHALAAGDLHAADAASPVPLTPAFVELTDMWRVRSRQLDADPGYADWITGAVRDERLGLTVGLAGFHGPPDGNGVVEVGYEIDPEHRRRGYARAALEFLLARAAREPAVTTVRASISPGNHVSQNLVLQYGFVRVCEQWDEEDGLEIVFEVPAAGSVTGPRLRGGPGAPGPGDQVAAPPSTAAGGTVPSGGGCAGLPAP